MSTFNMNLFAKYFLEDGILLLTAHPPVLEIETLSSLRADKYK